MELISEKDVKRAIADLSMCQFFPSDPSTQAAIGVFLCRICPHRQALEWLVRTFVDRVGKWEGPVELRAVLATRFRPSDGIEAYSKLAGFTPEESETAALEQHEQRKVGGWVQGEEPPKALDFMGREFKKLMGKVM